MKKILFSTVAFFVGSMAEAQTYPTPTFNTVTIQNPLTGTNGGTGVNNGSNTITLGGNLVTSGSSPLTFATTGTTSVTLPTSGTLLNSTTASSTYAPIVAPSFSTTLAASTSTETWELSPGTIIDILGNGSGFTTDYAINQTNAGSHTGSNNGAVAVRSVVTGSGINGPQEADEGLEVDAEKSNYLTSSTLGEVDGVSVFTRNGQDDTAGYLANVGGVNGDIEEFEGVTNVFNSSGTVLNAMNVQLGTFETGLTGGIFSAGINDVATTGNALYGLDIQSTGTGNWTHAIVVQGNTGGGITLTVDPNGNVTTNGAVASATGYAGLTSGSAAEAGFIGQPITADVPIGSAISLTTTTPANITSVALTAGNWACNGNIQFSNNASTLPTTIIGWLSTTSATLPTAKETTGLFSNGGASEATGGNPGFNVGPVYEYLASPTTLYLSVQSSFSVSTSSAYGRLTCVRTS